MGSVILDFVSQTVHQAPSEPVLVGANVFSEHRLKRSALTSNPGLFVSCCYACAKMLCLFNCVLMPEAFDLQMQVRVSAGSVGSLQIRREMSVYLMGDLLLIWCLIDARTQQLLQPRLLYPRLSLSVR